MPPLRVLLTNFAVEERRGSEMVVHDLALGLLERGHSPVVFSTRLGPLADELLARTVPVVDSLAGLRFTPDVIHGQHLAETALAMLHFPDTPAVYLCQDWGAAIDAPPPSPLVRRFVAVDHCCRDRLVCREGVPPERVRVVLNAVDLRRFRPRAPLPPAPRRALAFSNNLVEANHLPAIRAACARAGVELDAVGLGVGRPCPHPEQLLPHYDLVFAKARCALEAMAVGCAVVLCDIFGLGGMVTAANVDAFRPLNFGRRLLLREAVGAERLYEEVCRYDPADAAAVCRRIRAVAGQEGWLDQILAVYAEALAEPVTAADRLAQFRFAADCLRRFLPDPRPLAEATRRREQAEAAQAALREQLRQEGERRAEQARGWQASEAAWRREVERLRHAQAELDAVHASATMRWRRRLGVLSALARRARRLFRAA